MNFNRLQTIIFKATEMVATEKENLSCFAIDYAQGKDPILDRGFTTLAQTYAKFYGLSDNCIVEEYLTGSDIKEEFTFPMRQTMLLNFLEYCRLHDDIN